MRNESVIQRACEIWWDRHSGACRVNGFMAFVQEHALDDWFEDCQNLYPRERLQDAELPELLEFADDYGVRVPERDDDEDDDYYAERVREAVCESDPANEPAEVYEWYMVDDAAMLEYAGEVIYRGHDGPVWGRCTTGQSVILDHVIRELFRQHGYCWFEEEAKERGLDPVVEAKAAGMMVPEWAEVK